jgi:hypothetical protein
VPRKAASATRSSPRSQPGPSRRDSGRRQTTTRPAGGLDRRQAQRGLDAALDGAAGKAVHLAHEARGEEGAGAAVDAVGGAVVLDLARVHHHDAVGDGHGLLLVVGDVDEGGPDSALDRLELVLHGATELEVERAQRLVSSSTSGSTASARASATRWRWPPEISCGRLAPLPFEADERQPVLGRGAAIGAGTPRIRSPKATLSRKLMWGKRA